jgi:hypothetical protein
MRTVFPALLAVGAVLTSSMIAPASSVATCSDLGFENAAVAALAQRTEAIDDAYLEQYRAAKADAFAGWRKTINAPGPCSSQLLGVRRHLARNLSALWLSYAAMAAGDATDGLSFLVAASKEAGRLPPDLWRELRRATREAPLA